MKSNNIVLSCKCIREQNQFLLYVAGSKLNILSLSVILFTLSYILFDLWSVEEPYPYIKTFCKQGYSFAVIDKKMKHISIHSI